MSPTVSSDALFLTIMIDAKEGRDVATADVAGAYLNADMDDLVVMRLVGEDVTLMCEAQLSGTHCSRERKGRSLPSPGQGPLRVRAQCPIVVQFIFKNSEDDGFRSQWIRPMCCQHNV